MTIQAPCSDQASQAFQSIMIHWILYFRFLESQAVSPRYGAVPVVRIGTGRLSLAPLG